MIAYSSSIGIAGLAERISAAMPAAAGAAALVPWNGAKCGREARRHAVGRGQLRLLAHGRAQPAAMPFASKKCVTGPRELKVSGVAGVW